MSTPAQDRRAYPVMFTEPGDNEYEEGTMADADVLLAMADETTVQADGYRYASLGPRVRARLRQIAARLSPPPQGDL